MPCDMLMRTPSTPAANMASSICGSRDAGPMVANIFALLKMVLVSITCVSGWVLSKKKRHDRGNSMRIGFEFRAECFAQELLFALDANHGANCEYDDCNQQPDPLTNGQAGCQQHPEHARIDRIADDTIRPFCY